MKQPEIKVNRKTKAHTLYVWYDPKKRNWDAQIDAALEHFGLKNESVSVVALPYRNMKNDRLFIK